MRFLGEVLCWRDAAAAVAHVVVVCASHRIEESNAATYYLLHITSYVLGCRRTKKIGERVGGSGCVTRGEMILSVTLTIKFQLGEGETC